MTKFEYKGYEFRMAEWNADDYSDKVKGLVEVEVNNDEWEVIVEYSAFENDAKLTLADDESTTEIYHEEDNFQFDEEHVIAFLERNLYSVKSFVEEVC
ncbi:hypothetical protein [Staphylococcus kloosii]|jgi:hypothetical protein|uniref:hypothetical protein n=1 Tax=Staphylococcus kloosii TaxID=29384 RepID=UPI00189F708C|nr:hypothetical protein [Staphylococcus kloosii]MBF7025953.1 hypothetical protein [Staphylococcus kloosii]